MGMAGWRSSRVYCAVVHVHTVIPIQRLHAHKIETGDRKMRLASKSVEEEETRLSRRRGRGVPHSREIVAALKVPRPESVDQLETSRQ